MSDITFGSVCSGIEAASVAFEPLGWKAAWFSEIDPFPCAVLQHHYPDIPNLGDMTLLPDRILSGEVSAPDVFVGGTPCQAFSVAGLRQSLDDERGNLSLIFCEIANAIDSTRAVSGQQPSIIFWENVPGVLSTKDNAFGCFLAGLAGEDMPLQPSGKKWTNSGCVFGPKRAIAWRILDAQYFGLAQRRKRVFVIASAREGFDPSKILFEFEGVRRDSAPSRNAGKEVTEIAGTLAANGGSLNMPAGNANELDFCVAWPTEIAPTLNASFSNTQGIENQHIDGGAGLFTNIAGIQQPIAFHPTQTPISNTGVCHSISANNNATAAVAVVTDVFNCSITGDIAATMGNSGSSQTACEPTVMQDMQVRRLTPVEFERLQGFPDGYTAIPWRNKPAEECPDGPRYKALGNSWAVPVVRWIWRRISLAVSIETIN